LKPRGAVDGAVALVRRHRRLLGVGLFLGILLAIFEFSGLRGHFNLSSIRQQILQHRIGGLVLFVLLFSLGNLIQIPGWVFLAAAVLALGRLWGGVVTYVAAVTSCAFTFVTIRALGGDALRMLRNRVAIRLLRKLDDHPIASVALLRLLFRIELRARIVGSQIPCFPHRDVSRASDSDCRVLHLFRSACGRTRHSLNSMDSHSRGWQTVA
jgi:hypothetical protein